MNVTNTDNASTVPILCVVMGKQKQWGTYLADSGAGRHNNYAISFSSKVCGLVTSGNITDWSIGTDISNLSYWKTDDTNHGNEFKTGGWYLAYGK